MNIDTLPIQNFVESKGCYYSCDMLRISFELKDSDEFYMNTFCKKIEKAQEFLGYYDYNRNLGNYKYRNFWSFSNGGVGSVRVLSWLNGDKKEDKYKGYIEFNPNKCRMSSVMDFLKSFTNLFYTFKISSYDIAVDMINVERMEVMLFKDGRKYQLIENKGARTEYLGCHHKNGFVKLYDKQKESGLDFPCTRLELTYEADVKDFHYPEVYYCLKNKEMLFNLNSTQLVMVELLNSLEYTDMLRYYRRLSANLRTKLKPYLNGEKARFDFDMSAIAKIKEYIDSIVNLEFSPDPSKEIKFMKPDEKMRNGYFVPIPERLDNQLDEVFENNAVRSCEE